MKRSLLLASLLLAAVAAPMAHAASDLTDGAQYSLPSHKMNPHDTIDVAEDKAHHVICYTARGSESIGISCLPDPTYVKK